MNKKVNFLIDIFEKCMIKPCVIIHESTHLFFAKLLNLEVVNISLFSKKEKGLVAGFVEIKIPEVITRRFLLKYSIVSISPILLTFLLSLISYFSICSNLGHTPKIAINYILVVLLLCGFYPSPSDIIGFIQGSFSSVTGYVTDENNQKIKIK